MVWTVWYLAYENTVELAFGWRRRPRAKGLRLLGRSRRGTQSRRRAWNLRWEGCDCTVRRIVLEKWPATASHRMCELMETQGS